MQCNDARLLLHAYLDNELDAGDSVQLARHLADCPACARELERQTRLKALLQQAIPQHALPDAVRARVLSALSLSAPARAAPMSPLSRRLPMRDWHALPAALAASLLLLLGGGLGSMWQRHASDLAALTAEVVSSHVRSLQPQHLTDVLTSDRHTVKPWFDGKLDFSPQVHDLDAAGFVLVGGRLDVLHGRRVAALVYRRRLHAINLFQWPASAADPTPTSAAPTSADAGDGYTTAHWTQDGIAYWAASNLDRTEMDAFAAAFRTAPAHLAPVTR